MIKTFVNTKEPGGVPAGRLNLLPSDRDEKDERAEYWSRASYK